MYKRNEIRFFLVRVMLNMIKSDRSTFWKQYRNYTEYDGKEQVEVVQANIIDKMEINIEKLHWYQKEILRLYALDFNKNAK